MTNRIWCRDRTTRGICISAFLGGKITTEKRGGKGGNPLIVASFTEGRGGEGGRLSENESTIPITAGSLNAIDKEGINKVLERRTSL